MKVTPKKIYLPHLNYTLYVRHFKGHPDGTPNAKAYTERISDHSSAIYLSRGDTPCSVAHELIHVLQFLSGSKGIDFVREQEHFGYMMQYLMGQVLGYEWYTPKQ